MQKVIIFILSSILLTGCAVPLLPDLSANLARVNDQLKRVNYNARNPPGGSQTVAVETDGKVCDQAAFQAGITDQYVLGWNMGVGDREATYRFLAKNHPNNTAARHNYELYKGKTLSIKGTGNAMEYGTKMGDRGQILNPCQSSSYLQGESEGRRAVAKDLKTLAEQEIESRYE